MKKRNTTKPLKRRIPFHYCQPKQYLKVEMVDGKPVVKADPQHPLPYCQICGRAIKSTLRLTREVDVEGETKQEETYIGVNQMVKRELKEANNVRTNRPVATPQASENNNVVEHAVN